MRYNSEREQAQFVDSIILKLPRKWANTARAQHTAKAKISLKDANLWLLDLEDATSGAIEIGASDDDLVLLAIDLVGRVRVLMSENGTRGGIYKAFNLYELLEALCLEYGVRYPLEFDRKQIIARLTCTSWWLRVLRVAHNKHAEGAAVAAGLVSKRAAVYCSDDALDRRQAQRRRNIETLEGVEMMNTETGEIMKLSEIAKAGMANHENRRAELLTRVRGFEELAVKYGHSAEFVTVTCPSRMHAVLANGKANPKYDGTKPDMAQKYLVECWARVRALLAKGGVRFYGLRIAEPHHDATPHWHLILFYRKCDKLKRAIRAAFKMQFLADSGNEAGAKENRVKFVSINPLKGSAAGYVLKYVLKNIGGLDDEKSDEALQHNSKTLYERVEAWAACWRIRQFQQIGGHYVSVWRELRRIEACKLEGKGVQFCKVWQAAQKLDETKASFSQYIEMMGGIEREMRKANYQLLKDCVMQIGQYGESAVFKVLGVIEVKTNEVCANNRAEWVAV